MGFLQICAGVILLQLSKSAKDVPDTAVLNSDLDQIRTVGEQEQPESEPKADAIRGTAALIRRLSQSRQKMEADEARRVYEDKLRDQMEPISENEQVEWDGLRRRKTVLGPQGSISRRKTLHPPLGLTRFSDLDGDAESRLPLSPPPPDFKESLPTSRRRTSTSRISVQPFLPGKSTSTPVPLQQDGTVDNPPPFPSPNAAESMEMKHVFGLPSGLKSESQSSSRASPGYQGGKPIMWASDAGEAPKPKKHISFVPPSPRFGAQRQFSFQNMFHRHRDDQEALRINKDQHLKVTTEEERMGLTKGDSNTSSSSEDSPVERRTSPPESALPLSPGGGRSLPPIPTEEDEDELGDADFEKKLEDVETKRPDGSGTGGKGGPAGGAFL